MSLLPAPAPVVRARAARVDRWRAWSCDVVVHVVEPSDLDAVREAVVAVMHDVDQVASRFRPDSDLARVNAAPGRWVAVDPLCVEAVRLGLDAAAATGGLVHPLLGRPLVELGYDRTFDDLEPRAASRGPLPAPPALDSWREVELREDAVRIPAGTALDLGATAKAWAVDLAAVAATEVATAPALVGIGGDLRTVGGAPWAVAVSETGADAGTALVELTGAIATSGTGVRRWSAGAVQHHHLLDPRSGLPLAATSPWRTASVVAGTCVDANTASTAALVLGEHAEAWLAQHHRPARLVGADGVRCTGGWPSEEDR